MMTRQALVLESLEKRFECLGHCSSGTVVTIGCMRLWDALGSSA
jgi:hypothetical protein